MIPLASVSRWIGGCLEAAGDGCVRVFASCGVDGLALPVEGDRDHGEREEERKEDEEDTDRVLLGDPEAETDEKHRDVGADKDSPPVVDEGLELRHVVRGSARRRKEFNGGAGGG